MSPRYVVREITGYTGLGRCALTTDYWIADSWYGFDVTERWSSTLTGWSGAGNWSRAKRERACERRCAELSAEHDAWLAAG